MGRETDFLVIGGGMSGLSSALRLSQLGREVVVLEAGNEPGGSMALSGGLIWAPATYELAREYIPNGDERLQGVLVETLDEALGWLEGSGLPLLPRKRCMKDGFGYGREMGLAAPGRRRPFAAALRTAVEAAGADVREEPWRLGRRSQDPQRPVRGGRDPRSPVCERA